ncbi:hypothetical protein [Flagellimonas allohymeniacidonis]|uniref:TerB family tellurite resistance protein n=1 Tax=Flagellimonas allohymeniacidonis TaxID=2517819 RepID=A0A4Q8QAI3_9FLAO|nr:hypothetical protein [Allomuricauda hymeniacidonis]TAI47322.1 hypothetical protein EW142_11620 [Allomuricauda hymeniacidonis]
MRYPFKGQYHDAFASMVKITLRDGDASEREIIFLEHLRYKLSLDEREYEFIMQNYMSYPITAPYSKDERIKALYELGKILNSDKTIEGKDQTRWLGRVARSIGFEPNSIGEITSEALSLTREDIEFDQFDTAILKILVNDSATQ